MGISSLRIVTRESPLALWQARFVRARLQETHTGLEVVIRTVKTLADRFLDKQLAEIGGKGMFVRELEQALLDDQADLAVHSMKDVTVDMPPGLMLAAIMERADARDVLVSNRHAALDELPAGARVGTSSLRRQCQLNAFCNTWSLQDIRGNVGTRLQKLDAGTYDALILAAAGLQRLGQGGRIRAWLDLQQMLPAPGQGALGIETRAGDARVLQLVQPLNHEPTQLCVDAERALSRGLYGGCHLPLAGYAEIRGKRLCMTALVGQPDGSRMVKDSISGPPNQAETLGVGLAQSLLQAGADEILAEVMGDDQR